MQASEVPRAVAAATSIASALDLTVDEAIVLHDSKKLALRLLPCDVLARVAPVAHQVAQFEVDLARRLYGTESPVAALEPRVEPRVYERDSFVVTLWTYYEPLSPPEVLTSRLRQRARAAACRHADNRYHGAALHGSGRGGSTARCEPRSHPGARRRGPELLSHTLRTRDERSRTAGHPSSCYTASRIRQRAQHEKRPLFIDLETCCRRPVEFDLAHVPEDVSDAIRALIETVGECRKPVFAMVAAWRWDPGDRFPNGQRAARELLNALREGPPYPALDAVMGADQV